MSTREVNQPRRIHAESRKRAKREFEAFLRSKGLRVTRQREAILQAIISLGEHADADRITTEVQGADTSASRATIYRTLQLMKDSGLIRECHFASGRSVFELTEIAREHHDHIICTRCNRVVEFVNQDLEALQARIATDLGFNLVSHRFVLFGECMDKQSCAQRNQRDAADPSCK